MGRRFEHKETLLLFSFFWESHVKGEGGEGGGNPFGRYRLVGVGGDGRIVSERRIEGAKKWSGQKVGFNNAEMPKRQREDDTISSLPQLSHMKWG